MRGNEENDLVGDVVILEYPEENGLVGDVVTVEYPEVVCLAGVIEITIEDGRGLVGEGIITGDCSGLVGNVRAAGEEESFVGSEDAGYNTFKSSFKHLTA